MKRILPYLFACLPLILNAQTWEDANNAYAEGNYAEAIKAYEQLLTETPDAEIYYNLGNAYFKTGETAYAILSYERCLRLDPRHRDARFNLAFAQTRIQDNMEDKQTFFLLKWAQWLRNRMSENQWLFISVSLFLLFLVCLFVFVFTRPVALRKTAFSVSIIAFVLSLCGMWCGLSLHHRDTAREEAIVVQGIVNAKASPDKSGTDLFVLHEGTKVHITDQVGDWFQIHAGDNVGWIRIKAVERI